MHRTEKITSAHARFDRALNTPFYATDVGGWCVNLPGLKNDDFNKAGIPSIAKISRLDEVVRGHRMNIVGISTSDLPTSNLTLVIKGRVWTLTPEFYRRAAIDYPLVMHFGISRFGRSSYDMTQTFYAVDGGQSDSPDKRPVMSSVSRLVCVDTTTGRSMPWSKELVGKLSAHSIVDCDREAFPTLTPPTRIPDNAFKWRVRVRYDDIDVLFHTNQAAYVIYSMECAAQAASQRYYTRIVEDVAFYPVRRVINIYNAESMAGDELDVFTWEDDDDKMCLHFVIMKERRMIYYGQIDFFDCVLIPSPL